jgi:hypothetical protein
MNVILQWLQLILSFLGLCGIVFGVFKVVNRNNEEWRDRERRLVAIEQEVSEIRSEGRAIIALGTQISDLREEMKRIRDRLDAFLDAQNKR